LPYIEIGSTWIHPIGAPETTDRARKSSEEVNCEVDPMQPRRDQALCAAMANDRHRLSTEMVARKLQYLIHERRVPTLKSDDHSCGSVFGQLCKMMSVLN
jgi:hypothetical protein